MRADRPGALAITFIATLALAGLLVGCAAESPPDGLGQDVGQVEPPPTDPASVDPSRRGGSLRVSLQGDPAAIDPGRVMDAGGELVVDALFDSLVALNASLDAVPAAAADWTVGPEGLVYTFRLRQNGRFHDGEPVTAADFVRAFDRIATRSGPGRSFAADLLAPVAGFEAARQGADGLRGVRAVDRETLRLRLRRPDDDFLQTLAHPSLAPVPPAAAEAPQAFGEAPVGNGPFAMDQTWEHGQFIRLRRSPDHPRPPLVDEVVFQIYPDDGAVTQQYEDFTEGGLDVAHAPPSVAAGEDDPPDALSGPGLITAPSLSIYFFGFDLTSPPFDDPVLRRAVSLAIDREAITGELLADTRQPARGIVPPGVPGARSEACAHCRHDPEAARAALAEARLDGPIEQPIRLFHNSGRTHREIAEAVAEQLRTTLELEVTVAGGDLASYQQAVRGGEVDMFRWGWQARLASMGAFLEPLFTSEGEHNLAGYTSDQVDQLAGEAAARREPAAQTRAWQQAEDAVLTDVAVAPLFVYEHDVVVAQQVRGFRLQPGGAMNLEDVWLERTR